MIDETRKRIDILRIELENAIAHYQRLARINYHLALSLMVVTLTSSGVAGIGGIFFNLNSKLVGGLALLPGAIAVLATTLNLQGRANWHYRKKDALTALRRRLLFQLPESPSADNVASVSGDWTKLDDAMNAEWEKGFALNWSAFMKRPDANS